MMSLSARFFTRFLCLPAAKLLSDTPFLLR